MVPALIPDTIKMWVDYSYPKTTIIFPAGVGNVLKGMFFFCHKYCSIETDVDLVCNLFTQKVYKYGDVNTSMKAELY